MTGPTSSSSTATNVHFGFAGGRTVASSHLAERVQIAVEEWLRVIPDFRVAGGRR